MLLFCRSKYHKLKYGTELEQGAITPPNFDKDSKGKDMAFAIKIFSVINCYGTFVP